MLNVRKLKQLDIDVIGDTTFRGQCPLEDDELVTFINQMKKRFPDVPVLHIPNEKKRRSKKDFAELKVQKMKGAFVAGASDIVVIGFPSCVIEMKRQDISQSDITQDQIDFLLACQRHDAWVAVALGWEAAISFVAEWYAENYGDELNDKRTPPAF